MIEAQLLIVEVLQRRVMKSLTGGLEENSAYLILILPPSNFKQVGTTDRSNSASCDTRVWCFLKQEDRTKKDSSLFRASFPKARWPFILALFCIMRSQFRGADLVNCFRIFWSAKPSIVNYYNDRLTLSINNVNSSAWALLLTMREELWTCC